MKHHDPNGSVARNGADREQHGDSEVFITLSPVALTWSAWIPWSRLRRDASNQGAVSLPDSSGVYELKYGGREDRLAIGAAHNLRSYLRRGLVRSQRAPSDVRHLQEYEDVAQVEIRWAVVEKYRVAEEELFVRHLATFGYLPKYSRFI